MTTGSRDRQGPAGQRLPPNIGQILREYPIHLDTRLRRNDSRAVGRIHDTDGLAECAHREHANLRDDTRLTRIVFGHYDTSQSVAPGRDRNRQDASCGLRGAVE